MSHFLQKLPIPKITHPNLIKTIQEIKQSKNQEEAIKKSLELLNNRFTSAHFKTYILFSRVFENDPNKLWEKRGEFMHCHQQNFLLRVLLVNSGWFDDHDVALRFSLVWFVSPHQWVELTMEDGSKIGVDPWNYQFSGNWNQYASGFGFRSL